MENTNILPTLTLEEFEALSPAMKRVVLAQDVIESIKAKKYKAKSVYFSVNLGYNRTDGEEAAQKIDSQLDRELCDLINDNDKVCNVCAIGSVFASLIKKRDKFKVRDLSKVSLVGFDSIAASFSLSSYKVYSEIDTSSHTVVKYIKDIFDERQLALMECAFEGNVKANALRDFRISGGDVIPEDFARALKFYMYASSNQDEALIVIMQNIIDNNGTFIP